MELDKNEREMLIGSLAREISERYKDFDHAKQNQRPLEASDILEDIIEPRSVLLHKLLVAQRTKKDGN